VEVRVFVHDRVRGRFLSTYLFITFCAFLGLAGAWGFYFDFKKNGVWHGTINLWEMKCKMTAGIFIFVRRDN
jgi:hypothetical protein